MELKEKDNLLQTGRHGSVFGIDPTLTNLDKRLVNVPDAPLEKDAEPEPKAPAQGEKDGKE